jgi:tetratricopeptide (TPR) repeat protein
MTAHPPHSESPHAATMSATSVDPASRAARNHAASEVIARARELLEQGDAEAAVQTLRPVFDEDRAHAQVRSWYGLALGLARNRYHEAVEFCQSAVRQEFFNPDLYLNVARLNLAFGFRAESLRYLRRARMIDPGNESIQLLVEQLGPRSVPVLRFLPRRHLLNRWLGTARHAFTRHERPESPGPSAEQDHVAA